MLFRSFETLSGTSEYGMLLIVFCFGDVSPNIVLKKIKVIGLEFVAVVDH